MRNVPPGLWSIKNLTKPAHRLAGMLFLAGALTLLACTSAAPSECIKAAEDAGLPENVIEQLKKPGDLNAIERIALREVLKKAGLDDVCAQIN
ncbi:MAG: hypothetical protein OXI54_01265 [Chloroflexota bacterium]|nr:hypothetical protein [Chloroflexota bacterium]MDE2682764.1 hypothetical protein [Chloroflexota bacterium]